MVTTTDLSEAFQVLAGPFLLAGVAERHLRQIVNRYFSKEHLQDAKNPIDSDREAKTAKEFTIGEIQRLLERLQNWDRIDWHVDRVVFLEALQDLR